METIRIGLIRYRAVSRLLALFVFGLAAGQSQAVTDQFMSKVRQRIVISFLAVALLCGCHTSGAYRPNQALDGDRFNLSCEGVFDHEPVLTSGKSPVFPISMLNPYVIEDRKTRHLPMRWELSATFTVGEDGKTSGIQSTTTSPPSFGNHMAIAVRSWRFVPAAKDGTAVSSQCRSTFVYSLE